MRLKTVAVAATLAAGLALTGCGGGGESGGGQAKLQNVVLGNVLAPATFEARNFNWGNQSIYAQAVYDTLVNIKPDGKSVEPNLATEWNYNEDKTVLTMKLRDDVTFTDGTKFTADVAAQNLLRFRDGTSPQRNKIADLSDAKAENDSTLVITLKQANPAFLLNLGQAAGLQESPAAFDKPDVKTNPVGSGPYILNTGQSVVGSSYKFDKNPNYWNAGSVHFDSLTVKVFTDSTSELNALRGKQLDGAAVPDLAIAPQVKAAGFDLADQHLNFAGLMLFDRGGQTNPALANVKVRQAINYAIDAEAMNEVIAQGEGEITRQIFRPESPAYDKSLNDRYSYDPGKARELLKEAGYADGFELTIPTSSISPKPLAPLLQQQLGDVGIKTTFVDVAQNLIAELQGKKYGLAYFTLQRDADDWMLISNLLSPTATWNVFKYKDPKVEELIGTIRTDEGTARDEALKELNAYIVEQAWFAPWFSPGNRFATNDKISVELNQGNAWPNLWNITPKS
ncbi:peptide/nickel transport system substrate-binding protein [Arthrobacter sp. 31Cvi3.1E]|nr:peptide/nickel transport system substrate-binding protein [Arthrobacter sp. 31Cvi3.1E]